MGNLSPNGGGEPTGDLLAAINKDFGSFDAMKKQLVASTVAVQGSGWGTTLALAGSVLPHVPTRTLYRPQQVWSPCLALTSGSMPTTSSTRTSAQITCRLFSTLPTGMTWPEDSQLPSDEAASILSFLHKHYFSDRRFAKKDICHVLFAISPLPKLLLELDLRVVISV